jgi:hypothetical protein
LSSGFALCLDSLSPDRPQEGLFRLANRTPAVWPEVGARLGVIETPSGDGMTASG